MRIAHDVLQRFLDVPSQVDALRALMDDMGLEVKRVQEAPNGQSIFTLELLANRGDHHCYEGVATELCGRLGGMVRVPEQAELVVGTSPWPIDNQTDGCLRYTATLMEKTGHGNLPAEDLRTLEAAGIHSLTSPIDATNLVNLEIGQPTHAFDADTLDGPICIRRSIAGEDCHPLFSDKRVAVPEGTIVIADDSKILAVAGVIGCEESKTTESTTRLLIESATFDPVSVRKASRALDTHTDSSARFERGADPERALRGAGRVVHLLQAAGWTLRGASGQVGDWSDPEVRIPLSIAATNRFLGVQLSVDDAATILGRFGFTSDANGPDMLQVRVPPRRAWDVVFAADLYEEIAKAVGYNNTPSTLPDVDLGAVPSDAELRKRAAEEVLLGNGFYEVFTDGFYGRHTRDMLGITEDHPLWAHVETQNALDRGYGLLKNNALSQALEAVVMNARMRSGDVRVYEWTRTFHPTGLATSRRQSPCTERRLLWAIAAGRDRARAWTDQSRAADPWFFKGLVEELAVALRLPLTVGPMDASQPLSDRLHPGRQASIRLSDHVVGILGEVHPSLCKRHKLKRVRPVYLEVEAQALLTAGHNPAFVEPPEWQPIVRSLAFALPVDTAAGNVTHALTEAAPPWLIDCRISDHFDAEGVRSLTWSLSFANDPGDKRSADDVNAACEAMATAVTATCAGVNQR
jgi:phenylalanyl-tRNA synthetase beta chain